MRHDAAADGIRYDNSDCLVGEYLRVCRCGDGGDREQSDQLPLDVKEVHHRYSPSTPDHPP